MGPLVRFLPLVLDKLLTLLVRPPVVDRAPLNLGQTLLESVAALVQSVTTHAPGARDAHSRHSLLASYIQVTDLRFNVKWEAKLFFLTYFQGNYFCFVLKFLKS